MIPALSNFDNLIHRISDELVHYHNEPLAVRLRIEWVKLRARIRQLIPERSNVENNTVDEYYDCVNWISRLTEADEPLEGEVETGEFIGYGPNGEEVWL